jgi:hypothetical protein
MKLYFQKNLKMDPNNVIQRLRLQGMLNDDTLAIIRIYLRHPIAGLIANMPASTRHPVKDKGPNSPREYMDTSFFDEIKKFESFKEHGGWVGFNPTFVSHLVGCGTLRGTIWGKTRGLLPVVLQSIQYEERVDREKKKEWFEMHPDAQRCSEV